MNINKRRKVNRCTAMKWFPENENYLKLHSPFHRERVQVSKDGGHVMVLRGPSNKSCCGVLYSLTKEVRIETYYCNLSVKERVSSTFLCITGKVLRNATYCDLQYNVRPPHKVAFPGHIKHFFFLSVEGEKLLNISSSKMKLNNSCCNFVSFLLKLPSIWQNGWVALVALTLAPEILLFTLDYVRFDKSNNNNNNFINFPTLAFQS